MGCDRFKTVVFEGCGLKELGVREVGLWFYMFWVKKVE